MMFDNAYMQISEPHLPDLNVPVIIRDTGRFQHCIKLAYISIYINIQTHFIL